MPSFDDSRKQIECGLEEARGIRKPKNKAQKAKTLQNCEALSKVLLADYEAQISSSTYISMKGVRNKLPVSRFRKEILQNVRSNQVVVVCGETGSGKSTQIPQMIFEEMMESGRGSICNIVCTQPRRIAATSLAARVSQERADALGQSVGYIIRLERKVSEKTRITFVTCGILLRRLLTSDTYLDGVSHVIVDEVHERSQEIDFLLVLLKHIVLPARPDLKVILMSATVNAGLFSSYFSRAPVVLVPGITHPVEDIYLEQIVQTLSYRSNAGAKLKKSEKTARSERMDQLKDEIDEEYCDDQTVRTLASMQHDSTDLSLIESLVSHIARTQEPGAILVFLPGAGQIAELVRRLQSLGDGLCVHALHSSLQHHEQQRVFESPKDVKVRKVVVATNIAETSITIDDIVYVIDSGRANILTFDPAKQLTLLQENWISQANVKQRRGRAGRLRPGVCYHMYTKNHATNVLAPFEKPEILRVPLHQACLQVLLMGFDPISFLGRSIEAPPSEDIAAALDALVSLKAAVVRNGKHRLSPLGKHLALLPLDIHIGKLLIFASIFGCTGSMLTVAAAMSGRSPFQRPAERRDEVRRSQMRSFGADAKSDHLSLAQLYSQWRAAVRQHSRNDSQFCAEHCVSRFSLWEIHRTRKQLAGLLAELGFDARSEFSNRNNENPKIFAAVLAASLYPHIIKVEPPRQKYIKTETGSLPVNPEAQQLRHRLADKSLVFLHPTSFLFDCSVFESGYLAYTELVHTSRPLVRDLTMIHAYPLLLLCGELSVDYASQIITVDGWIEFSAKPQLGYLILHLRSFLDHLLAQKFSTPSLALDDSPLLSVISQLFVHDGLD